MGFFIAGILAAVVSWVGNRAALKLIGTKGIIILAPLVEELAKSGAAIIAGSSMVLTHGMFGLIEGVYDAWDSGWSGLSAGLLSFLGHIFYGLVTWQVWQKHGVFWLAVIAGYVVHTLWNALVMKFVVKKRRITG